MTQMIQFFSVVIQQKAQNFVLWCVIVINVTFSWINVCFADLIISSSWKLFLCAFLLKPLVSFSLEKFSCVIKMMREVSSLFSMNRGRTWEMMKKTAPTPEKQRTAQRGWLIGDLWVMQCRNSTEQQNLRQNQQRKMSDSPFNNCCITLSQTDVVKVTYLFKECTDWLMENQVCRGGDICKGLVWWTLSLRGWICARASLML